MNLMVRLKQWWHQRNDVSAKDQVAEQALEHHVEAIESRYREVEKRRIEVLQKRLELVKGERRAHGHG